MRGAMRSAISTFASLAIVATLAGCAGSSWQFWKTSAEAPTEPAAARTTLEPAVVTVPAPATAHPSTAAPAEVAVVPARSSNGFAEVPGLADVRFRSGQVTLRTVDFKVVDDVVRWLREHPGAVVLVEGHTDDLGTREENRAVGEKRAASIMTYLVSRGLEPARVSVVSHGSDRPACAEKTDACRAKNRRARFLVKQP